MNYIWKFLKIEHKVNQQTKNNIDVVAKRYMDSGKSRDAAYAQAMYESGVIDQTEYNNVMKSIK